MTTVEARPLLDVGLSCSKCGGALLVYREVCTHQPPCALGDFSSAVPHECTAPIVDASEMERSA